MPWSSEVLMLTEEETNQQGFRKTNVRVTIVTSGSALEVAQTKVAPRTDAVQCNHVIMIEEHADRNRPCCAPSTKKNAHQTSLKQPEYECPVPLSSSLEHQIVTTARRPTRRFHQALLIPSRRLVRETDLHSSSNDPSTQCQLDFHPQKRASGFMSRKSLGSFLHILT